MGYIAFGHRKVSMSHDALQRKRISAVTQVVCSDALAKALWVFTYPVRPGRSF